MRLGSAIVIGCVLLQIGCFHMMSRGVGSAETRHVESDVFSTSAVETFSDGQLSPIIQLQTHAAGRTLRVRATPRSDPDHLWVETLVEQGAGAVCGMELRSAGRPLALAAVEPAARGRFRGSAARVSARAIARGLSAKKLSGTVCGRSWTAQSHELRELSEFMRRFGALVAFQQGRAGEVLRRKQAQPAPPEAHEAADMRAGAPIDAQPDATTAGSVAED